MLGGEGRWSVEQYRSSICISCDAGIWDSSLCTRGPARVVSDLLPHDLPRKGQLAAGIQLYRVDAAC